ncbi:MAG: glycosyltransferase [Firmicutes bacterium]|nr:glycosyltransferase [Bacillota bacterium]
MRIVHITNDLDGGGVQTYLLRLLPALQSRGHQVHLVLVSGRGRLLAKLTAQGIPWTYLPAVGRMGSLKWPRPAAVAALAHRLRALHPDVVHTHLFLGNTVGRLAALRAGVPVVLATEHSSYFGKRWAARRLDRALALRTTGVVAVSQWVADFTARQEGIPRDRFHVLPHGVDLPPRVPPRPGRGRVGLVGRLHPDKGGDLFLAAMARVMAEDPAVTAVVAGDGPAGPALRAAARRLGIAGRVEWAGWVEDPARLWGGLDLVVLPSRREGFGLAALEAMAWGRPLVAADIPAFREITAGGRWARLVPLPPAAGVAAWAEAIRTALRVPPADPDGVRRHVATYYTFDQHLSGLERLYRELSAPAGRQAGGGRSSGC